MKKQILLFLSLILLSACSQKKPAAHPRHPNYAITKPKVKYRPNKKSLKKMVKKLQGSPYVWAEEGPNNFDCSGFTYYMYGSMGIDIPRVARNQAKVGKRISAKELQYGDLIFFATNKRNFRKITHVGMYLGDGWFTHASTVKHEVVYSNLFTSAYYKKRLRVCRRYLPEAPRKIASKAQIPWKTTEVTSPTTKTRGNVAKLEERRPQKSTQNKAIVIKAPIKEIVQSSHSGNFYVQVGSFIGKPKSALIYQISRHGFKHKIIHFPKDGKQISKLLIGPYVTRSEASTTLIQVKAQIQKDAFIAEIR
jgi:cell division septation protein DedD